MTPRLVVLLLAACGGSPTRPPSATPPGPDRIADPAPPPVKVEPPIAEQRPHDIVSPHGTRSDPYYWLRDDTRKDPAVLAYLAAENAYAEAVLGPHKPLEDAVFSEMRGRVQQDDSSVPTFDDGYWYYTRFEAGKQHPVHARKRATLEAPEEILLDANELAAKHAYYAIGSRAVTRDGKLLAWTEDTVGRRQYALRVKVLATGQLLPDTAANLAPGLAWANDNKTLFYTGKDPTTLRQDRVFRHALGGAHELVYKEDDGAFSLRVARTKSRRYVLIEQWSSTTAECRVFDADKPAAPPRVFLPRQRDHLYDIDHVGNRFLIRTNLDAKNFRVVEAPPGQEANRKAWKDVIPHRADTLVEGFAPYETFIAASVRTGGLRKVQVWPATGAPYFLDAPDAAYAMSVTDTPDPKSTRVRYAYDSMQTPTSVFEHDVVTKQKTLLKQAPVPTYDATKYASEYLHATATDGTQVPISVVYRKDTPRNGTAPILVLGYGSYGNTREPQFANMRVSLLDRGWVYAIAHIRGGQEMGRRWYEDGKLMKKMNTFTDFIAATEHLVAAKYAARDQVYAIGASAGGMLVGAVANMRPDLYRGIVAMVPFVDVVTTMLDESIPATTNEFEEWGNPKEKAAYDYMLAYSPYDNIKPVKYPALYVQTALWDSQVQYFEPAKWVAKLRATKAGTFVVLETDMTSGHGGPSGRFDSLREYARAYTFLLAISQQR